MKVHHSQAPNKCTSNKTQGEKKDNWQQPEEAKETFAMNQRKIDWNSPSCMAAKMDSIPASIQGTELCSSTEVSSP